MYIFLKSFEKNKKITEQRLKNVYIFYFQKNLYIL
jgi:hypothetical protein